MNRWFSLGVILLFGFASSKWYIGWSFLSVVLFEVGAYENLCTPDEIALRPSGSYACIEQNISVNEINLLTRFVWGGTMVVGGFLYDFTNSPFLVGGLGVAAFSLTLTFFIISNESLPLWNWAIMLIGFHSGMFSIVTVDVTAHLFPRKAAMLTGMNYGAQYLGTAIPIALSFAAMADAAGFPRLMMYLLIAYVPLMAVFMCILPFKKHHRAVEEVAFGGQDPEIEDQLVEDNAYSEAFDVGRPGSILDIEQCDPVTPDIRRFDSDAASFDNSSIAPSGINEPDFGGVGMDFTNYQHMMTGGNLARAGSVSSRTSKLSFRVQNSTSLVGIDGHVADVDPSKDYPVSVESDTSSVESSSSSSAGGCRNRSDFLREALSIEMILFEFCAGISASTLCGYWYTVVLSEFGPEVNAFLGYITPLYFVFGPIWGQISQWTTTCFSLSVATLFITLSYFLGMVENKILQYFACFILTVGASHANAAGPAFILEFFGRERFGKHTGVVHMFYTIFVLPPLFISKARISNDIIFPLFGILGLVVVLVLFGLDWYLREASVFRHLRDRRRARLQRKKDEAGTITDDLQSSATEKVRRRDTLSRLMSDLRSPPLVPRARWGVQRVVVLEIEHL